MNRTVARRIALLVTLATTTAVSATALANPFGGFMGGGAKDEEVKIESKDLHPQLSQFAGTELDPFKEKALTYTKLSIKDVDDFNANATKLTGATKFVTTALEKTKAEIANGAFDQAAISGRVSTLTTVVSGLTGTATQTLAQGKDLVNKLPKLLAGPNALKAPQIKDTVMKHVDTLQKLPDDFKALTADLGDIAQKLAAQAAGAASGAAGAMPKL